MAQRKKIRAKWYKAVKIDPKIKAISKLAENCSGCAFEEIGTGCIEAAGIKGAKMICYPFIWKLDENQEN